MLNMSTSTIVDLDSTVKSRMAGALNDLKKAKEIKKQMKAAQKAQAERVEKFAKEAEKIVGKIEKDENLKAKMIEKQNAFEKRTGEFATLIDTLGMQKEQLYENAKKTLALKSGVELVKKTKKIRDVNKKIKELDQKKSTKIFKDEADTMIRQSKLGIKKM